MTLSLGTQSSEELTHLWKTSQCSNRTGHTTRRQCGRRPSRPSLLTTSHRTKLHFSPQVHAHSATAVRARPHTRSLQLNPEDKASLRSTRANTPGGYGSEATQQVTVNIFGKCIHFTLQLKTEETHAKGGPRPFTTLHQSSVFVLFNNPSETVLIPLTNCSKHAKQTYDDQMARSLILQHPYASSVFSDCC